MHNFYPGTAPQFEAGLSNFGLVYNQMGIEPQPDDDFDDMSFEDHEFSCDGD